MDMKFWPHSMAHASKVGSKNTTVTEGETEPESI